MNLPKTFGLCLAAIFLLITGPGAAAAAPQGTAEDTAENKAGNAAVPAPILAILMS